MTLMVIQIVPYFGMLNCVMMEQPLTVASEFVNLSVTLRTLNTIFLQLCRPCSYRIDSVPLNHQNSQSNHYFGDLFLLLDFACKDMDIQTSIYFVGRNHQDELEALDKNDLTTYQHFFLRQNLLQRRLLIFYLHQTCLYPIKHEG